MALTGLLESSYFRHGSIEISCVVALDVAKAAATVGFRNLAAIAQSHGLPAKAVSSINGEEGRAVVATSEPDYLLVVGWSELLAPSLLDIPRQRRRGSNRHRGSYGCVGMHPTLLPEGRGRAPIPWTIIKGLRESGVTAFLLEDQADSGDVIMQRRYAIARRETATSLFAKAARAHWALGNTLAKQLATGTLSGEPQDVRRMSLWERRGPDDSLIEFSADCTAIDRLVRAQTDPYPNAYFEYRGGRVYVQEVDIAAGEGLPAPPGTIVQGVPWPAIRAKDGVVILRRFAPPTTSWRLTVGDRVG